VWKRAQDILGYTEGPRGESAPAKNEVTRHAPTLRVARGWEMGRGWRGVVEVKRFAKGAFTITTVLPPLLWYYGGVSI
jgi:hypothetical protein